MTSSLASSGNNSFSESSLDCFIPDHQVINLGVVSNTLVRTIRDHYLTEGSKRGGNKKYSRFDWARINHVFNLLPTSGKILDVGVGAGQLYNTLKACQRYESVVGVDIQRHSRFIEMDGDGTLLEMSVTDLNFPDKHFDAVICMEVLEHIEKQDFLKGLSELRRVCAGTLFMTVPFQEPEPLPSFHKLRFDWAEINEHFPNAKITILKKEGGVPWALLKEDCTSKSNIIAEPHDRISELYEGKIFSSTIQKIAVNRVNWLVSQTIGKRVLDVGCSQGITTLLLANEGFSAVGVDSDQIAINYAKQDALKIDYKNKPQFICSKIEDLEQQELGKFDTIIMGEFLEHFSEPHKVLKSVFLFAHCNSDNSNQTTVVITTPFGLKPSIDHRSTFTLTSFIDLLTPFCIIEKLEVVDGFIRMVGTFSENSTINDTNNRKKFPADELLKLTEAGLLNSQELIFDFAGNYRDKLKLTASRLDSGKKNIDLLRSELKELSQQLTKSKKSLKSTQKLLANSNLETIEARKVLKESALQYRKLSLEILLLKDFKESFAAKLGLAFTLALKSPLQTLLLPIKIFSLLNEAFRQIFVKAKRTIALKTDLFPAPQYSPSEFSKRAIRLIKTKDIKASFKWVTSAIEAGLIDNITGSLIGFGIMIDHSPDYALKLAEGFLNSQISQSDILAKDPANLFEKVIPKLNELKHLAECLDQPEMLLEINKILEYSLVEKSDNCLK